MKKSVYMQLGLVFTCLLLAFTLNAAWWGSNNSNPTIQISHISKATDFAYTGDWSWEGLSKKKEKQIQNSWIQIQISYEEQRNVRHYFGGIQGQAFIWNPGQDDKIEKGEAPLHFGLSRAAGELWFNGQYDSKGASGKFEFKANKRFCDEVSALCNSKPELDDLFQLTLRDASIDQLKEFTKTGLAVSVSDWLRLLNNGISPEFASGMNKALGKTTIENIIECRNNGLNPSFVSAFKAAGYDLNHRELIRARNNGINPDFAAEFKKGGFDLNLDQVIHLRNNGIQPHFAIRAKELGFGNIEEIIQMRNNGLTEDYLQQMREAGGQYSIQDIIRLRNNGVPTSFIKAVKKAGYNFNIDEIIRLRNNGVSENFLQEITIPDRKPLSAEAIIHLRSRGISSDVIRELRQ